MSVIGNHAGDDEDGLARYRHSGVLEKESGGDAPIAPLNDEASNCFDNAVQAEIRLTDGRICRVLRILRSEFHTRILI